MTTDAALDKDVQDQVAQICRDSRAAARVLATATRATKDAALRAMADELENSAAEIVEANGEDLRRGEENGLTTGLLDRLRLDEEIGRASCRERVWVGESDVACKRYTEQY